MDIHYTQYSWAKTCGYETHWHTEQKGVILPESLPSHLPSSVTDVWYPCGRVSSKSTEGVSMFSLASMPDVPPPSGTVFLKMRRGAGWGACGGGGARVFILLLRDTWQRHTEIICSSLYCIRFSMLDLKTVSSENNKHLMNTINNHIFFCLSVSVRDKTLVFIDHICS